MFRKAKTARTQVLASGGLRSLGQDLASSLMHLRVCDADGDEDMRVYSAKRRADHQGLDSRLCLTTLWLLTHGRRAAV